MFILFALFAVSFAAVQYAVVPLTDYNDVVYVLDKCIAFGTGSVKVTKVSETKLKVQEYSVGGCVGTPENSEVTLQPATGKTVTFTTTLPGSIAHIMMEKEGSNCQTLIGFMPTIVKDGCIKQSDTAYVKAVVEGGKVYVKAYTEETCATQLSDTKQEIATCDACADGKKSICSAFAEPAESVATDADRCNAVKGQKWNNNKCECDAGYEDTDAAADKLKCESKCRAIANSEWKTDKCVCKDGFKNTETVATKPIKCEAMTAEDKCKAVTGQQWKDNKCQCADGYKNTETDATKPVKCEAMTDEEKCKAKAKENWEWKDKKCVCKTGFTEKSGKCVSNGVNGLFVVLAMALFFLF